MDKKREGKIFRFQSYFLGSKIHAELSIFHDYSNSGLQHDAKLQCDCLVLA